jgi:RNA polymerase sigma-70 factor (ECF subfamily)
MAQGAETALCELDVLASSGRLDGYQLLHATRADLLRRLGRREEAEQSLRTAVGLAPTDAERRLLERRLGELCAEGATGLTADDGRIP